MTSAVKPHLYVIAAVSFLVPLVSFAQDRNDFVSFHVPHSRATYPLSINEARTVTGYYITKSGVSRGFVRREDGDITTFDVPGSVATKPVSINAAGDITGYYDVDSTTTLLPIVPQGFIRSADGKITTFGNTLNTDNGASFWAQPAAINAAGEVVGNFPDIALASFAFLRSATGDIQTFTLSDGAAYSTVVTGLNASGAIVGYSSSGLIDLAGGFLWDGQGPLPSPVSSAGVVGIAINGSTGTFPTGINADGTIVGCYSLSGAYQDFVRSSDGDITSLTLPGTIPACVTRLTADVYSVQPQSVTINDRGTITGWYTGENQVARAFIRFGDGTVQTFAHRGSAQTIPTSINNCDVITGYYSKGWEIVGFIREP